MSIFCTLHTFLHIFLKLKRLFQNNVMRKTIIQFHSKHYSAYFDSISSTLVGGIYIFEKLTFGKSQLK